MTEQELQELNKKLAEWRFAGYTVDVIGKQIFTGKFGYPIELFTQSPDACFKWLIPEATKRFGAMATYMATCSAMYESIVKKEFSTKEAPYDGKPALALCREIEELIDKNHKGV